MGVEMAGGRRPQAPQMAGRFWLTALAARVLGYRVPKYVKDDEAVRLVQKEES